MTTLGGHSVEKRSRRAVHVSNADDLLLEIPSINRVFGGFGGTRSERKPVSRFVLNAIQNHLLSMEPTKDTTDKGPYGQLVDSPRIFRGFLKSDITFISCKVRYKMNMVILI
jgi:hypothetical protein